MASEFAPQREETWRKYRAGHVTCSRFSVACSRKGNVLSGTAKTLAYDLIGELLTGNPTPSASAAALEWGIQNEERAIERYSLHRDYTDGPLTLTGFHRHPQHAFIGGSPDGLIGDKGLIEVKCPFTTREYVRQMVEGPQREYKYQVQGLLWVLEREWCDFVLYDPRATAVGYKHSMDVTRIARDDEFIKLLEKQVLEFRDYVLGAFFNLTGIVATPYEETQS